ncbi:MAG: hypothetical protein V2A62_02365 [Candidatus Woesearchaeota archaeon]
MISQISAEIKQVLSSFPSEDQIIFNNKQIKVDKSNFLEIANNYSNQTIAFIDGGQAEILSAGNFCLSFIRVFAQIFKENKKLESEKREFYLFTKAKWINYNGKEDLFYESKIFTVWGNRLIHENDLLLSSTDQTIKSGIERASISKISNIARRFAELSLAAELQHKVDFVVLDGTLEKTFTNEEKYLSKLNEKVSALAKTSSLFTVQGNSPVILLNKLSSGGCWKYLIDGTSYFVKLNEHSKYVFRFEGNPEVLPNLIQNSTDALFLGYPYGLILTDKMARVSNEEKNSLKMNFLLKAENRAIAEYLSSSNAHDILDSLG